MDNLRRTQSIKVAQFQNSGAVFKVRFDFGRDVRIDCRLDSFTEKTNHDITLAAAKTPSPRVYLVSTFIDMGLWIWFDFHFIELGILTLNFAWRYACGIKVINLFPWASW